MHSFNRNLSESMEITVTQSARIIFLLVDARSLKSWLRLNMSVGVFLIPILRQCSNPAHLAPTKGRGQGIWCDEVHALRHRRWASLKYSWSLSNKSVGYVIVGAFLWWNHCWRQDPLRGTQVNLQSDFHCFGNYWYLVCVLVCGRIAFIFLKDLPFICYITHKRQRCRIS